MRGRVMKTGTSSDWVGLFKEWREEIGVNHEDIKNPDLVTVYDHIGADENSVGHYSGRSK